MSLQLHMLHRCVLFHLSERCSNYLLFHQTKARHNDVESEVLAHNFTRVRTDIGPEGTTILCWYSHGGKTNKNNNRHYFGVMPARNPVMCPVFAKAALFLYRFGRGEDLPDWRIANSFFSKYTLRQGNTETLPADYNTMNECFHRLYKAVNVKCSKVIQ